MTTTIWENGTSGYYSLTKPYFVTEGNTLIIQQGTVIKCKNGTITTDGTWTTLPGMLVVCRGNVHANGTKTNPIIFTSDKQDV